MEPPPGPVPGHAAAMTHDDLVRLHEATADHRPADERRHGGRGVAYLHVLYLDGGLEGDTSQDGAGGTLSHSRGLLVVLPGAYRHALRLEGGDVVPAGGDLERTVLLHELGHAFGLVDRGVPMQFAREDHQYAGHSDNEHSVMHHGAELGRDGIVRGPIPAGFDAYDRLDIEAYLAPWRDGAS